MSSNINPDVILPLPKKKANRGGRTKEEYERLAAQDIIDWTGNVEELRRVSKDGLDFLLKHPEQWANGGKIAEDKAIEADNILLDTIISVIRLRYRFDPTGFIRFVDELKHRLALKVDEGKALSDYASINLNNYFEDDEKERDDEDDSDLDGFVVKDGDDNYNPEDDPYYNSEDSDTSMGESEDSTSSYSSSSSSSSSSKGKAKQVKPSKPKAPTSPRPPRLSSTVFTPPSSDSEGEVDYWAMYKRPRS